jgi:DNA-binding IclR family transcriptional regulator
MNPTDRAMSIFEAFESQARPLTLSELSQAAGLPMSTCHGIVRALTQRGYLYLTNRHKDLYPTGRLSDMARHIRANDPYLERLESRLGPLREATRETVIVGKRQRDEVVYLSVLEGPQTIRYSARAGDIKPLHSTSIGKALLSVEPDGAVRTWTHSHELPAVTSSTLTTIDALMADLHAGRQRGWFATHGESVSDVLAIAVPVAVNDEVLGIAVAGPIHRMLHGVERVASLLLEVKAQMEKRNAQPTACDLPSAA